MFERYWKNISFLRCNKEQLVLFNVQYILFSSSVEAFMKINEIPLRKKLRKRFNANQNLARRRRRIRLGGNNVFARWDQLTFPNPPLPGEEAGSKVVRRNRETRIARLSLAARRILSSGVVFHPGHTKGYIYMRRRARRRHVIVFEVTAIGTCEENVECSYTRVPLIENEHVQHPSLRGLLPPLLVLFSNAETNPAAPFLSKFYYVQSR